jgi:hypothetical protein
LPEKSKELANLARISKLKEEPGTPGEIKGLLTSGTERLADARNGSLAMSSRFDLAYNAAHAFSLAALRWPAIARTTATWCFKRCRTPWECL